MRTELSLHHSLSLSALLVISGLMVKAKMQEAADYNREVAFAAQTAILESFERPVPPGTPCPAKLAAYTGYREPFSSLTKNPFRVASQSLTVVDYQAVTDPTGNPDGTVNIVAADFGRPRNILSYAYRGSNFYKVNVRARCVLEF